MSTLLHTIQPSTALRPSSTDSEGAHLNGHAQAKEPVARALRAKTFASIIDCLGDSATFQGDTALVGLGDALELLKRIPDHSVSLILTDPPYHSTKKGNIYGDRAFSQDKHYIEWMAQIALEWRRVLKENGSLFCFCASEMSARLEVEFARSFNILSHVCWTKPNEPGFDGWKQKMNKQALRQWYPHSERIIFAEPATEGNLKRSPFGSFLRQMRLRAGLSTYDVAEIIGAYGKVNHGGSVSNWEAGRNIPSRAQYEKLSQALISTGRIDTMPIYEDAIRPFGVCANRDFTDVWTFPGVRPYKGKHPAEKPIELLVHAIEATTFPDDIVLDCFAGSGTTAVAALICGRKTVSLEIERQWTDRIAERIREVGTRVEGHDLAGSNSTRLQRNHLQQSALFQDLK